MATQQLAAIMFTDVVGYTTMMQRDKELAVKTIKYHQEILEQCIEKHKGKLIQYFGDGSLSVFNSATDALECAMTMQLHFRYHKDPSVPLRIGIHVGEVTFDDGKVFGDGVNLASRIESLGVPGSILFSHNVYQSIRNNPKYRVTSLGNFEFKNVDHPMEVFALLNEGLPEINKKDLSGKLKRKSADRSWLYIVAAIFILFLGGMYFKNSKPKVEPVDSINFTAEPVIQSIAILPFEIYSNDENNEFIAEGIADEIRYQLNSLSNLKVISRSSSSYYKGKNLPAREIGKQLDVAYILEGSVHKMDDEIKLSAQLINTQTDNIELSFMPEQQNINDVFSLESELAKEIVGLLKIKLSESEKNKLGELPTENFEAYEYFKKGQILLQRGGGKVSELDTALTFFKKAIELDSKFARAYVGLSDTYLEYVFWGRKASNEVLDPALDAAFRALELDDENGACYGALGSINFYRYEKQNSIDYLNKGIKMSPNYPNTYQRLAWIRLYDGDLDNALALLEKARVLDPLSIKFMGDIGVAYYYSHNYKKGIALMEQNLQDHPDDNYLRFILGMLYSGDGNYPKAIEEFTKRKLVGNTNWLLGYCYGRSGNMDEAQRILDYQLEKRKTQHVPAYMIATIYIGMDNTEKAIEWLETDYEDGGTGLFFWLLGQDPKFTSVLKDPRVVELMGKV